MPEASRAWNFPEKGSNESPRVLMIEDNPSDSDIVRRVLEDAGIATVETAQTTEQGIRMLSQGEWDLVLVDYKLPGASGLDALDRIRQIDPNVPTIVLTGVGDEQLAAEAIRRGADEYLSKDTLLTTLPTTVTMLWEKKLADERRLTILKKNQREEELRKVVEAGKQLLRSLPPDSPGFDKERPAMARRQMVGAFVRLYRAVVQYSAGPPSAELADLCQTIVSGSLSSRQLIELHNQAAGQVIRQGTPSSGDLASRLNEGLLLALLWLNDSWRVRCLPKS
jgi:CheY-like chemotaxis protein